MAVKAVWIGVVISGAMAGLEAQETAAPTAPAVYARFETAAELQVFPTDISPRYGEELSEGAVVQVRGTHGAFREVVLPLGVLGYVHKKFTTDIEAGLVSSKVKRLAFRYRPQAGEAPVALVDSGTQFRVAGDAGDWWIVRHAAGSAWVPSKSIVTFDEPNDTLVAAYASLGKQHRKVCDDTMQEIDSARAAATLAAQQNEQLESLRARFRDEMRKPVGEQSFTAIQADTAALIATTAEEDGFHKLATRFQDRVKMQVTIVEATMVANEPAKPADVDVVPTQPEVDPMSTFDAIGWLRHSRTASGRARVVLMKGEQVLFRLDCSTGRYDLSMFEGLEVGVRGPRARPTSESIRVLDVERIEVIRAASKRR